MGGYDEAYGIDIIAIGFRQCLGPNHSPIGVQSTEFSRSVREDLKFLREAGVIRLRSLAEISSISLRFGNQEVTVDGVLESGGSVRFKLKDTGLTEDTVVALREAFASTFLVPLDQSIDPTILSMGPSEIYQYILSGVARDDVQDYQRPWLGKLLERGLVEEVEVKIGKCTDVACSSHSIAIKDKAITECPTCQGKLTWQVNARYQDNRKKLLSETKSILQNATGWKFNPAPYKFESHSFYRLSPKEEPNRTICVFVNDRLNPGKVETFQRAMFPILVVHPQGNQRLPVIDGTGIAHIGLPYAIAASDERLDKKEFRDSCKEITKRLLRMEQERVLRTSRHSHQLLLQKSMGYNDRNYEADIYNILRSLFSFTVKWGGPNLPDGFGSLVYFPTNELAKPANFNWSYDAKFSDTTYEFAKKEFRQMYDYVLTLNQPKRLKTLGNSYDGHAIITNSMDESAMASAASYLWTEHRLGKERADFLLMFIRDRFLSRLWELVRENEGEFQKRSSYLPEFFVTLAKNRVADGYCLLEGGQAEELAESILTQDPIQHPLDAHKVKSDLRQVLKATSTPGKRRKVSGKPR